MTKVEIYTWKECPFCKRAKEILDSHGVKYVELDITGEDGLKDTMIQRAANAEMHKDVKSVPVVFVDDEPIGGCFDLESLEKNGQWNGVFSDVNRNI